MPISPIGVIHSPYTDPADIHPLRSRFIKGSIEIFPEYAKGLKDIDGFSHIYVLWWFHLSKGRELLVSPLMRPCPKRGVFATRHPCRPNPLGLTVVRLLKRDKNILHIKGVDMTDGTPVLDIKPYTRRDRRSHIRLGWLDEVERRER
ncbi:tRNA (N6-threonylcarbamoyladenosine(37)-N6)-methyltransferase TrmO [candidate division TA06 bacterium B3_TA06]|uniref:tRNA (N6-threonylcarbamoyladenosine(37)-N6)-methyltransferase TrmO n=1 Tax=candidate division TA06 bacterium B3_TA06 TaxID=2012487 RepID=A0A532V757_UNCT6|nr:MAG: tRNA (N6-threonylcarbamoyladenosine(37)-N6)-methyltransferase TrmO [candidate division TA06 bacterium B3_TA06]